MFVGFVSGTKIGDLYFLVTFWNVAASYNIELVELLFLLQISLREYSSETHPLVSVSNAT
jgi:hypothetical protein